MARSNPNNYSKLSENPTVQLMLGVIEKAQEVRDLIERLQEYGVEHEVLYHIQLGAQYVLDNADYAAVAERFNHTFASQGWIATESFCTDTMRDALTHHQERRFEDAEDVILDWFNPLRIQFFAIGRCGYFGDHHSRKEQLDEAFALTQEERYKSAIPLILIACEGFAADVLQVSLFSRKSDLTLFDTFVGHKSALPKLVSELTRSVSDTSEENAELPGRHGILHGKTLGYDTRSNCMKAWLLFIALTDLHIERLNKAEEPIDESISGVLSIQDVVTILCNIGARQARLAT